MRIAAAALALAFVCLGRGGAQTGPVFDPAKATVDPDAGLDRFLRRPFVATFFDAQGNVIADTTAAARYCITDKAAGVTTPVKPISQITVEECLRARVDRCPAARLAQAAVADPVLSDARVPDDFVGAARDAYAGSAAQAPQAASPAADPSRLYLASAVAAQTAVIDKSGSTERNRPLSALSQLGDGLKQGLSGIYRFFDGTAARQPLPADAAPQDPFFPSK